MHKQQTSSCSTLGSASCNSKSNASKSAQHTLCSPICPCLLLLLGHLQRAYPVDSCCYLKASWSRQAAEELGCQHV
jgi:hypothetical protein